MGASEEQAGPTRSGTTLRRGLAVLPVVLLSASWTVGVAGVGGVTGPVPSAQRPSGPAAVPAAPSTGAPDDAASPPASVLQLGRATTSGRRAIVPTAAGEQVPAVALAAYQRAAVVIGAADQGCHLEWPLVAAIGKVESDHGRAGGGALGPEGVAEPAIIGMRLDGREGTRMVSDSDGGRYDGDKDFDRAVGPLQFIPTTWSVVGVDADSDGKRNPQDVDDAALATAVHLCSGEVDLAKQADLRRAVHRYNNSGAYVDAVLSVMRTYAAGDLTAPVPAGYVVPDRTPAGDAGRDRGQSSVKDRSPAVADGGDAAGPAPVREPEPEPVPAPEPGGAPAPVEPGSPVAALLTRTQAVLTCTLEGLSELLQPARFRACVDELTKG